MIRTNTTQEFEIINNLLSLPQNTANGLSEILLKEKKDFHIFYIEFFGKNRHLSDDLFDFREYKINKNKLSLSIFMSNCLYGLKQTFIETFLQKFSDDDIQQISSAIEEGRVTLEYIFNSFYENINLNIMRYVL